MSTFADGYFVLHIDPECPGMGGADLVLHSIRKAEITTVLTEELQLGGHRRALPTGPMRREREGCARAAGGHKGGCEGRKGAGRQAVFQG